MRAFRSMVVANLKMTVRNRTALFWLLAFPIIFIVLFGYLFGNSNQTIDVGIAGSDVSPAASQVTKQLQQTDGFKVHTGSSEAELSALKNGDRNVVIDFTPGANGQQVTANLYWDQSDPQTGQIALMAVQQFLSQANAQLSQAPQPIDVQVQGVTAKDTRYIDFLVPGILAMSIMSNGLQMLSGIFVAYRERGILRRIRATPFPLISFISARIVTQVMVAVAQAFILLAVGKMLFHIKISGSLGSIVVMVVLGALAFLAMGFFVAAVSRNTEVADSLSNALAFPMMFLGGVFFPVDSAPAWLRPITEIIPLTYLANGLRDIMVDGASLAHVWLPILVMLATGIISLLLSVRFFRWEARAV